MDKIMNSLFGLILIIFVNFGLGILTGAKARTDYIKSDIEAYGKITISKKVYEVKEVQPKGEVNETNQN